MIITLSGASGNGKNKIVSSLIENGYNVIIMRGSDHSLTGQRNLVDMYAKNMESLRDDHEVHIFESSFVDILIYTTFLYGIYSDYEEIDEEFTDVCLSKQSTLVDLNIRLDGNVGIRENPFRLPVIDIWNAASNYYFTSHVQNSREHVLSPPKDLHDETKVLEYLSEETLRVIEEYAS